MNRERLISIAHRASQVLFGIGVVADLALGAALYFSKPNLDAIDLASFTALDHQERLWPIVCQTEKGPVRFSREQILSPQPNGVEARATTAAMGPAKCGPHP